MNCPICDGKTHVTDSRRDGNGVYRKRVCYECEHEFFTTEIESSPHDLERVHRILNRDYQAKYRARKRGGL